ncbi:4-carboxy-4-hydroxy-2-oxoadipate aldolase/oxaloacetate decarboxylase [Haladaptatus caseinilyticus]|uniref:4-carboxy-4-hydroxy-2-oxoadipate aldolase/oxaloacetate decarboxylase n=1 Tax=Haladaptatus caseinilyticus TaxID=2993314 RepID=UPI00224A9F7E|nr:4-carboxy-4-hydroxy-2-oxoadipate aldolase/oxaloacetate decarboxylase [Haladaptatus caseinilyticus]
MHTVEPSVNRPESEIVSGFEKVPSSIVSDVTGNVGVAMDSGMKPIYNGAELAGTAITVKASPGDNLIIHKAITLAKPGDVLVIDANGYLETGHLGELMCTSCKANDLAGIVIDGAIRDRKEIEEMEFPVYARGVHPQGPLKQDPGSINVTISCGGVTVDPGDIVVGDDEGIAIVPSENALSILERSHEKMDAEDNIRKRIQNGDYLFEISGYDKLYENLEVIGPEDSAQ